MVVGMIETLIQLFLIGVNYAMVKEKLKLAVNSNHLALIAEEL
jgi:hypothetical protein